MITKNNKQYKIVAIIPARSGSKRIPFKNIKEYAGKPLIYWSIQLAKSSTYIDDVIVSTDCEEIANISKQFGASVPFIRPTHISGDLSTDYEFMEHYINNTNDTNYIPDIIVHLRPTYPNRQLDILNDCIRKFIDVIDRYDSLRTVCVMDKPPFKMYTIENNELTPLFLTVNNINEPYNMPAQLLPTSYWHNGYIDIIKIETIRDKKSMTGTKIYPYIMDKKEIDDIDTIEEWEASEKKFLTNKENL